jgi:hypothetical protein
VSYHETGLAKRLGDVSPSEYDWREQFGGLDAVKMGPHSPLDVGKVRGLATAYDELLAAVAELLEVAKYGLPHPSDDPVFWTARMRKAWSRLRRIHPDE